MPKEIERKFVVNSTEFLKMAGKSVRIRQSYLSDRPEATVRIRMRDDEAFLTVKGLTRGAVRDEWEYPIPPADAEEMAERLAGGWAIDKTRYLIDFGGFTWEVDEFHGRHAGLILAEIELPAPDTPFERPSFLGPEVTDNPAYYNSTLARR